MITVDENQIAPRWLVQSRLLLRVNPYRRTPGHVTVLLLETDVVTVFAGKRIRIGVLKLHHGKLA
jgi:hypothetical protein